MEHRFPILAPRPDANHVIAREETLHSLLDGRARWPDGTPREIGVPLYERMKQKERDSSSGHSHIDAVIASNGGE